MVKRLRIQCSSSGLIELNENQNEKTIGLSEHWVQRELHRRESLVYQVILPLGGSGLWPHHYPHLLTLLPSPLF